MSQLIVNDLTKVVGVKTLFDNIAFTISSGEKVGLIGVNGTGKSTLLSIIAGVEDADSISMEHPNQYRIAYLPQEATEEEDKTVLETVFMSDAPIININLQYENAVRALGENPDSEVLQEQFAKAQNEMDALEAWDVNSTARTILTKLGIDTFDKKFSELSGGQRKRVSLAKVLIEPADLLLLDEPTNHLDVQSIKWLQDYLHNEKCAVIFVTHDRYFLDGVATHIYELADEQLYSHTGNYGDFLEAKAMRLEMAAATDDKMRNRYRNELKWIKRGARARSTKQKARIGRFEELSEQVQKDHTRTDMDVTMKSSRLGRKVIEGINITKSFNDKQIIKDFSFLLQTGDRIAVVGPNGVGKSTLLNIIAGELAIDSGKIDTGTTVKVAYFHQHIPVMDDHQRIIEYIRETSNDIEDVDGGRVSASQMLERFLFPTRVHGTLIGKLSGGERKRLYLLRLLMEQPNVLLLDEPTNDLDLDTLAIIESFIDTFPGVVITISHDRFFLDRTSKELWILDGSGHIEKKLGIFSDYVEELHNKEQEPLPVAKEVILEQREKKKLSYAERKEWETIESNIEELEGVITEKEEKMERAGSDYEQIRLLTEELETLNNKYEHLLERWEYLQELQ